MICAEAPLFRPRFLQNHGDENHLVVQAVRPEKSTEKFKFLGWQTCGWQRLSSCSLYQLLSNASPARSYSTSQKTKLGTPSTVALSAAGLSEVSLHRTGLRRFVIKLQKTEPAHNVWYPASLQCPKCTVCGATFKP